MDSASDTPTQPVDYAALSAGYGALLGALVLAARRRDGGEPLRPGELVPLGAACFALSKLVTKEKAESWVRQPFVEERPGGERRPKGRRLRYAVGELLSCSRCTGAWSALGLVALRVARPQEARVLNPVLAVSAVNDFLHGGFSALCSAADAGRPSEGQGALSRRAPRAEPAGPDRARAEDAQGDGGGGRRGRAASG